MMYCIYKILYILSGRRMSILIKYFRKKGILIGNNCNIYSNIVTPESYLVKIGDNVTIAGGVRFVTHDNSISKILPQYSIMVGPINVKNNVFIGAGSTILPGVTIGENCIIAAGSVVTKSCKENSIIGGNPAKQIRVIDGDYIKKISTYGLSTDMFDFQEKKNNILNNRTRWINR